MKRKIFIGFFLIFLINIYAFEKRNEPQAGEAVLPKIGLVFPFIINQSTGTFFFNEHFIFELLSSSNNKNYEFFIINLNDINEEFDYLEKSKIEMIKNDYDYLIYSSVYSIENNVFLSVKLIEPYNNKIIFSKLYRNKVDNTMNENITLVADDLLKRLNQLKLTKIIKTQVKTKKETENLREKLGKTFFNFSTHYYQEIYVMNGFFKNNSQVMSFLTWYTGYCLIPLDYLYFDFGFLFGFGTQDEKFSLGVRQINEFFFGTYAGLYVYLKGVVEPHFGFRVELVYLTQLNRLQLAFPIDFGFKIYITNKDVIRISTSLPINDLDFFTLTWDKKFTLGLLIGYGRKI